MTSVQGHSAQGCQGLPLQFLRFPGGEWHVRLTAPDEAAVCTQFEISALIQNADHIMQLLMLTDALRRVAPDARLHLNMPYVPYARQDRVANPGEALSIRVFCDLINAQHYDRVIIQDPHSDVTSALLNRVVIASPLSALQKVLAQTGPVALLAPSAAFVSRSVKAPMCGCSLASMEWARPPPSARCRRSSTPWGARC